MMKNAHTAGLGAMVRFRIRGPTIFGSFPSPIQLWPSACLYVFLNFHTFMKIRGKYLSIILCTEVSPYLSSLCKNNWLLVIIHDRILTILIKDKCFKQNRIAANCWKSTICALNCTENAFVQGVLRTTLSMSLHWYIALKATKTTTNRLFILIQENFPGPFPLLIISSRSAIWRVRFYPHMEFS